MVFKKFFYLAAFAAGVLFFWASVSGGVGHLQAAGAYQIAKYDPALIEKAPPELPDVSGYTTAAVKATVPDLEDGDARVFRFSQAPISMRSRFAPELAKRQGAADPLVIFLISGVHSLRGLAARPGPAGYLTEKNGVYTATLPVVVGPDAALVLAGPDAAELRLSRDDGVYISNYGRLYIVETTVAGWDLKQDGPSGFIAADSFRPFIVSWSGSEMHAAGAKLAHLGYQFTKSYGITYTTGHSAYAETGRPTGWIVDSRIEDVYYGFYSWEADRVVLAGNTFADNVVYGIDPHDRSTGLIIAGNRVYGTREKHGIVISREVSGTWIMNNESYENAGSGIMLDRKCEDNHVAFNVSRDNRLDGIVLYETPNNMVWGNTISRNGSAGLRIRNTWNVTVRNNRFSGNRGYAVYGYVKDLSDTGRDHARDPWEMRVGATIEDNVFERHEKGLICFYDFQRLRLAGIKIPRTPLKTVFKGDLQEMRAPLISLLFHKALGAEITRR